MELRRLPLSRHFQIVCRVGARYKLPMEAITFDLNGRKKVVKAAVRLMPSDLSASPAQTAAKFAIMTDKAVIPAETKAKLDVLFGKYW